jgi:hypothetical protein
MRSSIRALTAVVATAMLCAIVLAIAGNSFAAEQDETRAHGPCKGTSDYTVGLGRDIGVEMELEIETGIPGQVWDVQLYYNDHLLVSIEKTTEADGGFEVRKQERNAVGKDAVQGIATNQETGEVCEVTLQADL